jgi:hypothetical protein
MKKLTPKDLAERPRKSLHIRYSEVLKLREQIAQAQSKPPVKQDDDGDTRD